MNPIEDLEKIKRFEEIEKVILSPEFDNLSKKALVQFPRELPVNIPYLDRHTYNPRCQHLLAIIATKLDSLEAIPITAPKPAGDDSDDIHYWYKKPLGIITIGVIIFILGRAVMWVITYYVGTK